MTIREVDYTHSETEFEEMRELLVKSYLVSRKPFNLRLAVIENWNHGSRFLEPVEYFTSRIHLWRDEQGDLAGFLIRGNTLTSLQIDYNHRYLEAEMLDWAERHWAGDQGQIRAFVFDWDTERQKLLEQRGYEKGEAVEDVRIYDLARPTPEASLPPGFRIASMAEYPDPKARIDLENSIWGASLDEAWFRGKSSAPSYSADWDLIAVSPDGELAAENLVWRYPRNHTAEIDPLGTHPDYRRQGLARAMVLESFKRMRANGIQYAYIASETQDPIVAHLYASLQPVETYQAYLWRKQVN